MSIEQFSPKSSLFVYIINVRQILKSMRKLDGLKQEPHCGTES